ncbi:hypothetical protein AB6802_04800 [Mesorhizobium sp. RCC_202]|jgi:hypothetical protein|uniref:hypothetical protein n=1 Tax=Mesorhizobium sp. RCC_202 TaxID=3239222 RepID=UPI003524D789
MAVPLQVFSAVQTQVYRAERLQVNYAARRQVFDDVPLQVFDAKYPMATGIRDIGLASIGSHLAFGTISYRPDRPIHPIQ